MGITLRRSGTGLGHGHRDDWYWILGVRESAVSRASVHGTRVKANQNVVGTAIHSVNAGASLLSAMKVDHQ